MKTVVASIVLLTSFLNAAEPALLEEAQTALREGIPQVGIQKLQEYLTSDLSPEETRRVQVLLVHGYIALKKTENARKAIDQLVPGDDTSFLTNQSYLVDQNWLAVTQRMIELPSRQSPYFAGSVFARAEARRGLGQNELADQDYQIVQSDPLLGNAAMLRRADLSLQANPVLQPPISLPKTDDFKALQSATLLRAENLLLTKHFEEASKYFRSLVDNPQQLTSSSFAAINLGLARSLIELNRLDEAGDLLENFINERPLHDQLGEIFSALNEVYRKEKNPSQNQLRRWSRDSINPARQALAIYYQSQFELRDKGSAAALTIFSTWLEKFPEHPLRASVLLNYGQQLIVENKISDGIRQFTEGLTLPASNLVSGELHAALATAYFESNKFALAAGQYRLATKFLPDSARNLLYNTALCWLRESNFEQFVNAYQNFSTLFPDSNLRRDLLIEEGFFQARSGEKDTAKKTLGLFLRDFPEHRRVSDAHLALAELSLNDSSAETERQLILASQTDPSKDGSERTAYLRFFQKGDGSAFDFKKQIDRCESFLKEYPNSSFEAEVRFKLGEAYFGEKNYSASGTQFELISTKFPDSPMLEQARFLAGQSAIRTMNPSAVDGAISLFEQVVRMKGPLQAYARYEQANVKKNNASFDEALVLYNDLLNQNPPDDLQAAALAAKAETLYLQGGADLKKVGESVKTFDQLANLAGVSRYWRNLALYKKGKGLAWLGEKDQMLAAYYDALAMPANAEETPEYHWFYRAGFDAAESLESGEQWEAAIAIYRKLAAAKGPRSDEAKVRIKRLRLEHFIWEK